MASTQSTNDGRGEVKNPETDQRLKQNREGGSGTSDTGSGDSDGRGRVKDPEHDGRLKENRDNGVSMGTIEGAEDVEQGGQGRVKDPENDGRLKENR